MSKKIIFKPAVSEEFLNDLPPVPAIKKIPEWFKKLGRYANGEKNFKFYPSGNGNLTIKACPPFLDVFSSGYLILLKHDIFVDTDDNGNKTVAWATGGDEFVSTHSNNQISKEMIPEECDLQAFKFNNVWSMILPKGYSALITHPLNRYDLPFITLSGIVDLDSYNNPVSFPFLFKKNASGIISAGTPIAQIFPFKRESWSHEIDKHDPFFSQRQLTKLQSMLQKGYKTLDWHRKEFK